jgi:drug/metabolite transporter (DMT)-like permease
MPYLLFLSVCAIWGSNFMLMKQAALGFSGLQIATGRVLGGMVVLGVFWWLQGGRWRIRREDLWPLAVVILIGYAWPYTLQPILVAKHGGALIGMSVSFVPLMTVVLSLPLLGVVPTRRQLVGVLGALACLLAILYDSLQRDISLVDFLLAGSVPLGYSIANICIRRRLAHISSLDLSFLSMLWTALCLIPLCGVDPTSIPETSVFPWWPLAAIVLLGTLGTGLANWMFNLLIIQQGPLFAGMVTNLVPLGAILWGWADHEHVSALQIAAMVGLIFMVALVQTGAAKST